MGGIPLCRLLPCGDVFREKGGIGTDACQERRAQGVCTPEPEKTEARPLRHTTAMKRLSGLIENRQFDPCEIVSEATAPND